MPPPALSVEADGALRRFRQFYNELYSIKRELLAGNEAALIGRRPAAGSPEEQLVLAVRQRLNGAIAAQGFGGAISAGAPAHVDPGYVMTALANSMLLHDVTWRGRDGWAERPLEVVLYRSRTAGDRIFDAVEELARRRTPDADGVAMTILLAFEMGYRGRYHGSDDRGEIERLKARLFDLVFHRSSATLDDFDGLTAGAAEPLAGRDPVRLPQVRPWGMAIGGVVVGYLLVSWLLWWAQVSDIVDDAAFAATMLNR